MGIVLEFYAVPAPSADDPAEPDAAQGVLAAVDTIRKAGILVGSVSVNSGAAGQLFEWMASTRLAPLVSIKAGGSALVFADPGSVAQAVDRDANAVGAPEMAATVANALSDAVEEALWRDQALAAVLP